jgi:hypothetical protein
MENIFRDLAFTGAMGTTSIVRWRVKDTSKSMDTKAETCLKAAARTKWGGKWDMATKIGSHG